MAQRDYHNPSGGYDGTTSNAPTPYTRKTTDEHKGKGKGKDIRTRNHCFGTTACLVTRADGTQYIINTTRNNTTAKRRTKKQVTTQRMVSEAIEYGRKQHERLSLEEIRANNGL